MIGINRHKTSNQKHFLLTKIKKKIAAFWLKKNGKNHFYLFFNFSFNSIFSSNGPKYLNNND